MQAGSELSVGLGAALLSISEELQKACQQEGDANRKIGNAVSVRVREGQHHEQATGNQESQTRDQVKSWSFIGR